MTTGRYRDEESRASREESVELREEELRARNQPVQAGEVEIGKEVVSEEKTIDVPVTREEVVVERRPVERRPADAPIGEGERIGVPVYEEKVEVEKQPVVYEEVSVGKRPVQETERVSDTVRREEARVGGDADVRGWDEARAGYRQAWETRHGSGEHRWEDEEPSYRYGHEMAADPRYQGREWSDVESDLRSGYGDWSRRGGHRREDDDDSAWEHLKENVRDVWERTRGSRRT